MPFVPLAMPPQQNNQVQQHIVADAALVCRAPFENSDSFNYQVIDSCLQDGKGFLGGATKISFADYVKKNAFGYKIVGLIYNDRDNKVTFYLKKEAAHDNE